MCGILFCLSLDGKKPNDFVKRLESLKARGPDEMRTVIGHEYMAGHTRNCIVNPLKGQQPIENDTWVVLHNGEIYNGMKIKTNKDGENIFYSNKSDSYKILDLLEKQNPIKVPEFLDGIFGYCAYNKTTKTLYVARDQVGVIPLYKVQTENQIWISSELKAILNIGKPDICLPGFIYSYVGKDCTVSRFFNGYTHTLGTERYEKGSLYKILEESVNKRVYSDVPWGVLLSGGLDSSVVCSLAIENEKISKSYPVVHTFSIGLKGSEDLKRAKDVADFWKTVHHSIEFTEEEGFEALNDVIYAIESYDVTTIRASVPMYLLGKAMKKCGIKMVLSGEGSDELLGGYLYNHHCPGAKEMHKECVLKMDRLHYHDCLRANKSLACHGIECRVPFLDKKFVHHTMFKMDPRDKLSQTHPDGPQMEKWTLRNDFMFMLKDLPQIIARQKEQFSDGVGNKWINYLKEKSNKKYTDEYFKKMQEKYIFQPPQTKEALLYREIFQKFFNNCDETVFYTDETVACSSEVAIKWSDQFKKDPSAESLKK
ncbi:MAG: asparagine synthase B [Legionellales bacterium]|nr:asparagine synthase B [Legionellales bacterium]|tara:strand:+ start:5049 stop:6665 length:1617 start_codon:yes stop_codon:yes gene_type:complete